MNNQDEIGSGARPTEIGVGETSQDPVKASLTGRRSTFEKNAGPRPIFEDILAQIGPINWHNAAEAQVILEKRLLQYGSHWKHRVDSGVPLICMQCGRGQERLEEPCLPGFLFGKVNNAV